MNRIVASSFLLLGMALVSGCSATSAPQSTPTPTATLPAAMTPAEAKASYKLIAQASCTKAQSEGVTEQGADFIAVMTPKAQNYKDFSAAYFAKPDEYGLIWELDGFNSCADWYTFSMADEAGQEADIKVTFNPADSTYTTVEDFGDAGVFTNRFTVADGRLAMVVNIDEPDEVTKITYGALTEYSLKILTTAVDRHLAEG